LVSAPFVVLNFEHDVELSKQVEEEWWKSSSIVGDVLSLLLVVTALLPLLSAMRLDISA
jgi:hypothetical protein